MTPTDTRRVLRRIAADGPLMPRDIPSAKARFQTRAGRRDDPFPRPSVAKLAMEYLWRTGKLAVSRREGRQKVYDLAERVIPNDAYRRRVSAREYRDWACREALGRMVCGSPARIARFFDAIPTGVAATWCNDAKRNGLAPVVWAHADGTRSKPAPGLAEVVERVRDLPAPPRRLRLLNPFDPLIHDRERTRQVFGFDYNVEIWVPPAKRKYGYYVLPILEGERFTGRLDAKVDRKRGTLTVLGLWWEDGVKPTPTRRRALEQELRRLAVFCGAEELVFARGRGGR